MRIVEKRILAKGICLFVIEAPLIAKKAEPGQFVIVRHKENGERIPLTIADYNRDQGTITLVCHGIGKSTQEINQLNQGDSFLDVLGPLGLAMPIEKVGKVLCVAGGLGVAPMYPKTRILKAAGNHIISIIGARSQEMLIMTEEMEAVSNQIHYCTDDGSFGHHGFVTDVLSQVLQEQEIDLVVAIGPLPMMAAVAKITKEFAVPTQVSLNALMVDGTGMCGGCRVTIGEKTKFACVDGPVFDAHQVNFAELLSRQNFYRDQEQAALHQCRIGVGR